ncbi:PAAR domain-containing protein [Prosthecobacter sp. SYSU 5D2]
MGKPAARLTDMHTCPMVTPGTPPIPHVGGPISGPCVPTVLIGMMPAATVTDMCVCVGPPDTIAMGSPTVFIGGKMAARMGDPTMHGGVIVMGCPTVLIGEVGMGGVTPIVPAPPGIGSFLEKTFADAKSAASAQSEALKKAAQNGTPFCEVCPYGK